MSKNGVLWHSMAEIQRDTMSAKDRKYLEKALAALAGVAQERWPARKALRLEGEPLMYMLVLPRGVRAYVSPRADRGVDVHYLATEERIRSLYEKVPQESGHA